MNRLDIIKSIGEKYLTENIENGEFSYSKGLKEIGKDYLNYVRVDAKRNYQNVDLRFVDGNLSVLVETKAKLTKSILKLSMEQLQHYVLFEKELTGNKVIAILAATQNDEILVWQDGSDVIDETHIDESQRVIKSMEEYKNTLFGTRNDKISLVENTNELNEILHQYGISEGIRSQFVGTCLLALKYDLAFDYPNVTTSQIRSGIQEILENLLDKDLNKASKLVILKDNVIDSQDVRDLKIEEFQKILYEIKDKIIPYINDKSTMGQDLLNLFFTTFNKYVGKADKNQAFTPDHIVHFMCKVVGINRNSVVLDPTCGSGAFLVRAMTEAMADCDTDEERERNKKEKIFGIEFEEKAYGLATTNMLIHGDGNSNILKGSCFDLLDDITDNNKINRILMNPPYNAQRKHCNPEYVKTWKSNTKQDPSKGFHFVYETVKKVKEGKLAVLLPMQCAIGNSSEVKYFKKKMLEEHSLDAVFSLPIDMFHPGASASACCMVFNLGIRHGSAPLKETFFGYFKDDGFEKRKNIGRMERKNGLWQNIEEQWLNLYFNRESKAGLSVTKEVTSDDEWLAEAYMETDYSALKENDFQQVINDYIAYLVRKGEIYES